jgi:hypothetical protein
VLSKRRSGCSHEVIEEAGIQGLAPLLPGYPASDSLIAEGFRKSSRWRKKAYKQQLAAVQ